MTRKMSSKFTDSYPTILTSLFHIMSIYTLCEVQSISHTLILTVSRHLYRYTLSTLAVLSGTSEHITHRISYLRTKYTYHNSNTHQSSLLFYLSLFFPAKWIHQHFYRHFRIGVNNAISFHRWSKGTKNSEKKSTR